MHNTNKNREKKNHYISLKVEKKLKTFLFLLFLVQAIAGSVIAIKWVKICVSESLNGRYRVSKGATFFGRLKFKASKKLYFQRFFQK